MLDQNRFSQVFVNVLSHAIKFTSNGGITLNVLWAREDSQQFAFEEESSETKLARRNANLSNTWFGQRGTSEPIMPRKNSSSAILHKRVASQISEDGRSGTSMDELEEEGTGSGSH